MQGVVGVVILQGIVDVPARCGQRGKGSTVHIAASGIGRAVGAVAAHRENRRVPARQSRGCGQRQLLIASAETFAGQVHDRFPARDERKLPALPCVGAGDGAEEAARFPRFAAELVGQENGFIAPRPASFGRRRAELAHAAGDLCSHVVQRLGRLLRQ